MTEGEGRCAWACRTAPCGGIKHQNLLPQACSLSQKEEGSLLRSVSEVGCEYVVPVDESGRESW